MVRRGGFALVVALLLTLLTTGAAAGPNCTAGAPGVGDPYFPTDGNGGYDVARYELDLAYDPASDVLDGRAAITARSTQDLSAFNSTCRVSRSGRSRWTGSPPPGAGTGPS